MGPGRRVDKADVDAAGDFAGPRKDAIWEKSLEWSLARVDQDQEWAHLILPPGAFKTGDEDIKIGIFGTAGCTPL